MKIIQNVKFSLTIFNFIVILFIVVAPLAQLVEHPTLNRQVPGSNPWWRTNYIKGYRVLGIFQNTHLTPT